MQQKLLTVLFSLHLVVFSGQPARGDRARLEDRLVETLGARDPATIERAARRLGLAGMAAVLERPGKRRRAAVAVLEAAPLLDRAWVLLPHVVKLMAGPDRALASMAGAAAVGVTEGLQLPDLERTEDRPVLADDTCARAGSVCGMLLALARNVSVSLDVRVRSVMALAHLQGLSRRLPQQLLLGLLSDGEPRVREAAVELYAAGGPQAAIDRLARQVREDPDAQVARAAAAALCAQVERRRGGSEHMEALKRVGALPRIRRLAESLDASDDQLLDLARCLARSGSKEDRRALARLGRRSPTLRRLLRGGVFR